MTNKQDRQAARADFMSKKGKANCLQISRGEAPFSQRAAALLALNAGNTQAQASEVSGLSLGQVRYWIARFRAMGLEIFPKTLTTIEDIKSAKRSSATKAGAKKTKKKKPGKKKKTAKKKEAKSKKSGKRSKSKAGKKAKAKTASKSKTKNKAKTKTKRKNKKGKKLKKKS